MYTVSDFIVEFCGGILLYAPIFVIAIGMVYAIVTDKKDEKEYRDYEEEIQ